MEDARGAVALTGPGGSAFAVSFSHASPPAGRLLLSHSPDSTRFALALRATVDAPQVSGLRWGALGDVREGLRGAYDSHGWRPLWISGSGPTPAAKIVLRELRESRDRGLDPDDYDVRWLDAEAATLGSRSDSLRAVWDLAFSVATARYALALDRGRVDPRSLHATLLLAREAFDISGALVSLATSTNPVPALRALEPPFYHYRRLVSVLQTYRLLAADSSLAALPDIPRGLKPGTVYPGAPKLRRLLTLLGDLTDSSAVNRVADGDTLYDDALAKAIKHFQRRQGFGPDGVIGDSTRLRLTRTFASQVRQIELTLERWRWLPRTFSAPPIIVNIPGFRLYALRGTTDAESEMLTMDVVVGNAVKHDTPLLAVDLVAVQFQPPWNVPTSIQREEIRPKAIADSGYLAKEQYELLVGGKVVVPTDSLIKEDRVRRRGPAEAGDAQFARARQVRDAEQLRHLPARHPGPLALRARASRLFPRLHPGLAAGDTRRLPASRPAQVAQRDGRLRDGRRLHQAGSPDESHPRLSGVPDGGSARVRRSVLLSRHLWPRPRARSGAAEGVSLRAGADRAQPVVRPPYPAVRSTTSVKPIRSSTDAPIAERAPA